MFESKQKKPAISPLINNLTPKKASSETRDNFFGNETNFSGINRGSTSLAATIYGGISSSPMLLNSKACLNNTTLAEPSTFASATGSTAVQRKLAISASSRNEDPSIVHQAAKKGIQGVGQKLP